MFGLFLLVSAAVWAVWYLVIRAAWYTLQRRVTSHVFIHVFALLSFVAATIGSAPFYTPQLTHAFLFFAAALPLLLIWRRGSWWSEVLLLLGSVASFTAHIWFATLSGRSVQIALLAAVVLAVLYAAVILCARLQWSIKWLFYAIFFFGLVWSDVRAFALVFSATTLALPSVDAKYSERTYWYLLAVAASVVLVNWNLS